MKSLFILYVRDQERSRSFYSSVLGKEPELDVPGMTEFNLDHGGSLGLMPESGIARLLGSALPDPSRGNGIPRAELYLRVDDAARHHARAIRHGATEISPLEARAWGDRVAYCLDPDGHVLAFAEAADSNAGGNR